MQGRSDYFPSLCSLRHQHNNGRTHYYMNFNCGRQQTRRVCCRLHLFTLQWKFQEQQWYGRKSFISPQLYYVSLPHISLEASFLRPFCIGPLVRPMQMFCTRVNFKIGTDHICCVLDTIKRLHSKQLSQHKPSGCFWIRQFQEVYQHHHQCSILLMYTLPLHLFRIMAMHTLRTGAMQNP